MKHAEVCVIDYGAGNTGSVVSALNYLGVSSAVVREASKLDDYDKLVLPGVGSFRGAMRTLCEKGMNRSIRENVLIGKKPILGICLGFQMLFTSSTEEGLTNGLGLLDGRIEHLKTFLNEDMKFPHIGFNQVEIRSSHPFFRDIENGTDFYFVHSYGLDARRHEGIRNCRANYGGEFVAAVAEENIMGTQFHPEKSQSNGLLLLRNFLEY